MKPFFCVVLWAALVTSFAGCNGSATSQRADSGTDGAVGRGGVAGTGVGGTGGIAGTGTAGTGGMAGTGAAGTGGMAGRAAAGTGGMAGTGVAGKGGVAGTGAAGAGGLAGTGAAGTGGVAGTGAAGTGGMAGTGAAGKGGMAGTGAAGTGGVAGTGAAGTGGVAGTGAAGRGGVAGTGVAGTGGAGVGGGGGTPGACVSGATGARVARFRWTGSGSGSTASVVYEANTLADTSRWRVTAGSASIGFTPVFADPFLGAGGLDLEGTTFIDVELSTAGLSALTGVTIAVFGRSYNTTTSGSFGWQTFDGTGAAPTNLVSNIAPYQWYRADATAEIRAGESGALLRLRAGPSSNALIVNRVELCFDAP